MESKLTCGSRSLVTLKVHDQRLAYLQVIGETVNSIDDHGLLTLKFYELWNLPKWKELIGNGDAYGALRLQARYGNLKVQKLFKNPMGSIRVRDYHVENGRWLGHLQHERLELDEEPMLSAGLITLPRIVSVTYSHATLRGT